MRFVYTARVVVCYRVHKEAQASVSVGLCVCDGDVEGRQQRGRGDACRRKHCAGHDSEGLRSRADSVEPFCLESRRAAASRRSPHAGGGCERRGARRAAAIARHDVRACVAQRPGVAGRVRIRLLRDARHHLPER